VRAVRLIIDGDRVTVSSSDGYGYFAGRLVPTPNRLRAVDADGVSTAVPWKEGARPWLSGAE
jgi:hypothetical protein